MHQAKKKTTSGTLCYRMYTAVAVLLLTLIFPALTLQAGTTGSGPNNLIALIGTNSTVANGDYYSSSVSAGSISPLDTYYSYWLEVTDDIGRLRVRLFDADIDNNLDFILGGSFNTDVTYQLLDPTGTVQATLTCAAGGCGPYDNSWQTMSTINNPAPGIWELRVDMSSAVTTGDDVNVFGITAFEPGAAGSDVNIFYHFSGGLTSSGVTRSVTNYPLVTSGCTLDSNDYDFDSNGSISLTSRLGSSTPTTISGGTAWSSSPVPVEGQDASAEDYGIWTENISFGTTDNHGPWYVSPEGQSMPGGGPNPRLALDDGRAFRVYLPTGRNNGVGGAPVKPYLAQWVAQSGSDPNQFTVTVRVVNPTPHDITNAQVSFTVPGGISYNGVVLGFPTHGSSGAGTWSIPTLPAGETAVLAYNIEVPTPGTTTTVTGTVAAGGTQATWDDETGTAFSTGSLCELRIGPGLTLAVISRFEVLTEGGQGVVEWDTASEVGTTGFHLERKDTVTGEFVRLNDEAIPGLGLTDPQGGSYRFPDDDVFSGEEHVYRLIEEQANGTQRRYGPYKATVDGGPVRLGKLKSKRVGGRPMRTASVDSSHYGAKAKQKRKAKKGAATARKQTARQQQRNRGTAVKFGIQEDGLYYLGAADIAPVMGLSERKVRQKIRKGKLDLTHRGGQVAWVAAEDGSGLFFYGEKLDSNFTRDNVYWLKQGQGLEMSSADGGSPIAPLASGTFLDRQHVERDEIAVLVRPTPDYWYWSGFMPGMDKTLDFELANPAAGADAALDLHLQGFTDGNHEIEVQINGNPVGSGQWNGPLEKTISLSFDPTLLQNGANQIRITDTSASGNGPVKVIYLNGFDIHYPRAYTAVADQLAFTTARDDGADQSITVDGFSSDAIWLLDISNPTQPAIVENSLIDADGSYSVSFVPEDGEHQYLALSAQAFRTPAWLRSDATSKLRRPNHRVDYLVIAPSELYEGAMALADYRSTGGLRTKVVLLEDIYDEFNDGIEDPWAIQRFLSYAWNNWRVAPIYVALTGDGSYDHRDLLGQGESLVPAIFTATPDGIFAADNLYGIIDGVQEMAIGRIPARTNEQLAAYVDKLAAWESDSFGNGLVELLADNDDAAGDFPVDSDSLKALVPASLLASDGIYLSALPLEDARERLFDALDAGRDMINYLGHGGMDRLAAEGLLTSADVADVALLNNTRTPIVNALTCVVNRFEIAGVDSLGQEMVLREGGGAVAMWAPTGLSYNASAVDLNSALLRAIHESGWTILGDAILEALREYATLDGVSYMPKVYVLLGDPATTIQPGSQPSTGKRNARQAGTGNGTDI